MTMSSDIAGGSTGIGSLPLEGEKAVLDRAFAVDIPYLPSLPALGVNETMLEQGLAGFPDHAPESHPPGRLWQDFLARLASDSRPLAKLQLVGPRTAGLSLPSPKGDRELRLRLKEWLLKRAIFMVEQLQALGKQVIFFWDEPALESGKALENLRFVVEGLRTGGAKVGIHCCAAQDLSPFLDWPLDFLSFDFSLVSPWEDAERLWVFRRRGGRLALGVVPTLLTSAWHPRLEVEKCRSRLQSALGEAEAEGILRESLLTPACGLGMRSPEESAAVFTALAEFQDYLRKG